MRRPAWRSTRSAAHRASALSGAAVVPSSTSSLATSRSRTRARASLRLTMWGSFLPSLPPHHCPTLPPTPPTLDFNLLFSLKLGYSFINNFWPNRPCCLPPSPSLPSAALIIYEIEETVKGIGIVVSLWRPISGSAILRWNSRWGLLAGNTPTPLVSPTLRKRLEVT